MFFVSFVFCVYFKVRASASCSMGGRFTADANLCSSDSDDDLDDVEVL